MSNHIINNNCNNYYAFLYNNIYSECELKNIHIKLTKKKCHVVKI